MDKFADIQAFVAVVETQGFSAAALRLGVGKSVVSRRVGLLEKRLGVQLMQRTTRRLSLTDAGRQFHARAVHILADLEDAEQAVVDEAAELRGSLKLAAPLSFGLRHLSPAVADFLNQHPGIELDLDLNDRWVNLVEEGFDMAVRIGTLKDSSLLARRLGRVRFVTCASPEYLQRHGTPGHPSDLEQHAGLQYSNLSARQYWRFRAPNRDQLIAQPDIRMRANNGDVLVQAAIAGMGIVISPTFIVAEHLRSGRLQTVLEDFSFRQEGIYAVYPPGRLVSRRIRAFSDFLATRFGDRPYWEQGL